MARIVLDAGHGKGKFLGPNNQENNAAGKPWDSSENNATGPKGTLEKDLTLIVALGTYAVLTDLGHQVFLTRSTDVNVRLVDRAAVAKDNQAPVFVSIHFNGNASAEVQGTETLNDTAYSANSKRLATQVQAAVVKATGLRDRGVKNQSLAVLRPSNHLPETACCLVEISFLTNPQEEDRLLTEVYQARLANALANGINEYLKGFAPGPSPFIEEPWWEVLGSFWKLNNYFSPVRYETSITLNPFGPYDTGTTQNPWQFRTSLHFVTGAATAPPLFAMTDGCVFYLPGSMPDVGKLLLRRVDLSSPIVSRPQGLLPIWYPQPRYIVYDNVPKEEARKAAVTLLSTSDRDVSQRKLLKKRGKLQQFGATPPTVEQMAALWLTGGLPDGIFALAGEMIGKFAPSSSGEFALEVSMVDRIDPPPQLFYNPSYFIAAWNDLQMLKDSPVFPELLSVQGPPCANGVIHLVSGGGSSALSSKLALANTGDTILITDSDTYTEALLINKGVNIMSTSAKVIDPVAVSEPEPSIPTFPEYPTLSGNDAFRPITFESVTEGIAYLGRVVVTKGRVEGLESGIPGASLGGMGGGIFVNQTDRVVISSCFVESCKTLVPDPINGGNGGGVQVHHSSPGIYACVIRDNQASGRGAGLGSYGYGWPSVYACLIQNNTPYRLDGHTDGGGISIQVGVPDLGLLSSVAVPGAALSDPILKGFFSKEKLAKTFDNFVRIVNCNILDNRAVDDGGGVYITNASRVIIRGSRIHGNTAVNNGGGIRLTFGSYLVLRDSVVSDNISNVNKDINTNAGGGGVAARNAGLLRIAQTDIVNNVAYGWAGGGLSFISVDEGAEEFHLNLFGLPVGITFIDWNRLLVNQNIYAHRGGALQIDADTTIANNRAIKLPLQTETQNHAKGGGVYLLRNVGIPAGDNLIGATAGGLDKTADGQTIFWPIDVLILNTPVTLSPTNQADSRWDDVQQGSTTDRIYFLDKPVETLSYGHADDATLAAREANGLTVFVNAP